MSHRAMSTAERAWMAAPRRPYQMLPRYSFSQSRSTCSGSSPSSMSWKPWAMACDEGASTMARMMVGEESASPSPVMPSSVWMRRMKASRLESAAAVEPARRTMGSRRVMRMVDYPSSKFQVPGSKGLRSLVCASRLELGTFNLELRLAVEEQQHADEQDAEDEQAAEHDRSPPAALLGRGRQVIGPGAVQATAELGGRER